MSSPPEPKRARFNSRQPAELGAVNNASASTTSPGPWPAAADTDGKSDAREKATVETPTGSTTISDNTTAPAMATTTTTGGQSSTSAAASSIEPHLAYVLAQYAAREKIIESAFHTWRDQGIYPHALASFASLG